MNHDDPFTTIDHAIIIALAGAIAWGFALYLGIK
jgi:hypothetical protein